MHMRIRLSRGMKHSFTEFILQKKADKFHFTGITLLDKLQNRKKMISKYLNEKGKFQP